MTPGPPDAAAATCEGAQAGVGMIGGARGLRWTESFPSIPRTRICRVEQCRPRAWRAATPHDSLPLWPLAFGPMQQCRSFDGTRPWRRPCSGDARQRPTNPLPLPRPCSSRHCRKRGRVRKLDDSVALPFQTTQSGLRRMICAAATLTKAPGGGIRAPHPFERFGSVLALAKGKPAMTAPPANNSG